MSDKAYTKKQGQYLAYIHTYTLLHRRPPSHADMIEFFRVTPPSVVSMLNRLQSRGLIAREPGVARSVRVLLAREELPPLVGPDEVVPDGPTPPSPDRSGEPEPLDQDLGPIYQLRIDLDGASPPIWRRILVPAHITFEDLNVVVESAMGWAGYHLHMFTAKGWYIGAADPNMFGDMEDTLDEDLELVSDYLIEPGDRVKFEYDFGDSWMHTIKLEQILEPDLAQHYPNCIKGRRACPPEDVGGIWGYSSFLDVIGDPHHPDHDEMSEWIGGTFDAEAFSLERVNARLSAITITPTDVAPAYQIGGPHVLTLLRWEMMDPDLPWQETMVATLYDPPLTTEDGVQRIQTAESPQALVEMIWDLTPWLLNPWSAHVADYGTSCLPFLVDAFEAVDQLVSAEKAAWYRDQLILTLTRLGAPAIPALLEIYDSAPRVSRTLICVALGRLGAREHVDLIWKELEDNPPGAGTGGFMGPLWALIDLGDSRAADVLSELLDEEYEFRELWAMVARAGDVRTLFHMTMATVSAPVWFQPELAFSLAAVVRRSGRVASIEALKFLKEVPLPDGTQVSVGDLVDGILFTDQQEIDDHFKLYYQGPTQEDMADLVRRVFENDWEYGDSRRDAADDLDLFGDGFFSDTEDGIEGAGDMTALRNPPSGRGIETVHFPSGRPLALPGRNDPCWCGSGKKYKNCHWREDHLGDTG